MDKFTASNGIEFQAEDNDGPLMWRSPGNPLGTETWIPVGHPLQDDGMYGFTLRSMIADALREFFAHERDVELGRWRDAEDPKYYVISDERGRTVVVNELTSRWMAFTREYAAVASLTSEMADAAVAVRYFAAHPEPKPWHDAKHGEVWVVDYQGREQAVVSSGRYFTWPHGSQQRHDDPDITSARRIFPEVSDD